MLNLTEIAAMDTRANVYSDLHKDCYGYRPRDVEFDTLENFQKDFDYMAVVVLPRVMQDEDVAEQAAIVTLEASITIIMNTVQGCTRQSAIRFLDEAEETGQDWGYFEYHMGVPYGYVEKEMKAV
jgi:hypothetical protein